MQRSNSSFYVVSLIVIISVASFFVSWKMLIPKYHQNKTNLKTLEQEIGAASAKLESLKVAKQDIDALGPIFDQMFVAIPKDKDEANIISEIEAMATVNQLAVPGIQITDGEGDDTAGKTVMIAFNVNGSFENITKLTNALENDLKFMNIKNLTLSSSADGLSASYQIEAYKAQESASLSNSAIPGGSDE